MGGPFIEKMVSALLSAFSVFHFVHIILSLSVLHHLQKEEDINDNNYETIEVCLKFIISFLHTKAKSSSVCRRFKVVLPVTVQLSAMRLLICQCPGLVCNKFWSLQPKSLSFKIHYSFLTVVKIEKKKCRNEIIDIALCFFSFDDQITTQMRQIYQVDFFKYFFLKFHLLF